jgi:hypothetical protein
LSHLGASNSSLHFGQTILDFIFVLWVYLVLNILILPDACDDKIIMFNPVFLLCQKF